jgi:hypothetical protein
MDEHRKEPRSRALKTGKIIFNNRFSVVDCTVRNLSPSGAKLVVGDQAAVPDEFELTFPADGSSRACRVMGRRMNEIGVAFA